MKTQLHEVTGKNRYCGPTAIAAICGITTDEASRVVRSVSGKRSVCSMSDKQMLAALQALGCTVDRYKVEGRPTANQWIQANKHLFKDHHVILTHGHHYGTLLGHGFLCSLSEREVVALNAIPKMKARVVTYFVVKSLPDKIGTITKERFPLKPARSASPQDARLVGHGLGALQDDPESSQWPSGTTIKLTPEEYAGFERAMQWPEDLPMYEKLVAQNLANAREHASRQG